MQAVISNEVKDFPELALNQILSVNTFFSAAFIYPIPNVSAAQ